MQTHNPNEVFNFVRPFFLPDPIPLPVHIARIYSQRPNMEPPITGDRPCRNVTIILVLIDKRRLNLIKDISRNKVLQGQQVPGSLRNNGDNCGHDISVGTWEFVDQRFIKAPPVVPQVDILPIPNFPFSVFDYYVLKLNDGSPQMGAVVFNFPYEITLVPKINISQKVHPKIRRSRMNLPSNLG